MLAHRGLELRRGNHPGAEPGLCHGLRILRCNWLQGSATPDVIPLTERLCDRPAGGSLPERVGNVAAAVQDNACAAGTAADATAASARLNSRRASSRVRSCKRIKLSSFDMA